MTVRDATPGRRALEAASFFLADMQAGIGPFLGILLLGHGWHLGRIGMVMTLGALAGVAMTTPAGALVDRSRRKRMLIVGLGTCTMLGSGVVLLTQDFALVALSQVATAIAGAAIGPAMTGMTLGLVRQRGFARQNGRNQVANHAGNLVGAALSGLLGWAFGLAAVFWLSIAFGALAILSVLRIPASAIDDAAARGLEGDGPSAAGSWRVLARDRRLLGLAVALMLFHLGNAALLPLLGMAMSTRGSDPAAGVALTIVIAQGVMVLASLGAVRAEARASDWLILFVSLLSLPVRGLVAARLFALPWGMVPVQLLDGVGAGLQSVVVPNIVARSLAGTGRVNVGQGFVMTAQGIGASLSPALGGWMAESFGFPFAFTALGACAVPAAGVWWALRGASAAKIDADPARALRS